MESFGPVLADLLLSRRYVHEAAPRPKAAAKSAEKQCSGGQEDVCFLPKSMVEVEMGRDSRKEGKKIKGERRTPTQIWLYDILDRYMIITYKRTHAAGFWRPRPRGAKAEDVAAFRGATFTLGR